MAMNDAILGVLVDARKEIEKAGEAVRDGHRERAIDSLRTCLDELGTAVGMLKLPDSVKASCGCACGPLQE